MHRLGSVLLPFSLLLIMTAGPAAESASTGTGTALETQSGSLLPARDILSAIATFDERKPVSRMELKLPASLVGWEADVLRLQDRQREHRSTCHEALRRANRDEIMRVTSQCVRSDLLQEMNILRKEENMLEGIPLVSADLRVKAATRLQELLVAEAAVVDAIDADVFRSSDDLLEAKQNLHRTYRIPWQEERARIAADRQWTWLLLISGRLLTLLDDPAATIGEAEAKAAAACLSLQGENLRQHRSGVHTAPLADIRREIQTCRTQIRELLPATLPEE